MGIQQGLHVSWLRKKGPAILHDLFLTGLHIQKDRHYNDSPGMRRPGYIGLAQRTDVSFGKKVQM
jgi:hypothetical protein